MQIVDFYIEISPLFDLCRLMLEMFLQKVEIVMVGLGFSFQVLKLTSYLNCGLGIFLHSVLKCYKQCHKFRAFFNEKNYDF